MKMAIHMMVFALILAFASGCATTDGAAGGLPSGMQKTAVDTIQTAQAVTGVNVEGYGGLYVAPNPCGGPNIYFAGRESWGHILASFRAGEWGEGFASLGHRIGKSFRAGTYNNYSCAYATPGISYGRR